MLFRENRAIGQADAGRNADYLLVLLAIAAPFYLNDFAGIYVKDWRWWLAIDYLLVKLAPLAVVAWAIGSGRMTPADFGLVPQRLTPFLTVFLGAALAGTLIDQNAYRLLEGLPGYAALGGMPAITSRAWNWFDLTVGLLFVGVLEELVFRGFACTLIRRYTANPAAIVVISAVAFGLIHWSLGLHAVIATTTIGAVFMAIYLRTCSAPALMLAHFVVNFVDFAGVIPKAVFKLV